MAVFIGDTVLTVERKGKKCKSRSRVILLNVLNMEIRMQYIVSCHNNQIEYNYTRNYLEFNK